MVRLLFGPDVAHFVSTLSDIQFYNLVFFVVWTCCFWYYLIGATYCYYKALRQNDIYNNVYFRKSERYLTYWFWSIFIVVCQIIGNIIRYLMLL